MILYSGSSCLFSHQVRFTICEKGPNLVDVTIKDTDLISEHEKICELNPYGTLPILSDREMIIYDSKIISEYLNERYPHPPLYPFDPVGKAKTRLALFNFEEDLFKHVRVLDNLKETEKNKEKHRKIIAKNLKLLNNYVSKDRYIMGEQFSILDVFLAPLLLRLDFYKISLGTKCKNLLEYAQLVFSRPSFLRSLTPIERAFKNDKK